MIRQQNRLLYSDSGALNGRWAYNLSVDMAYKLGRDVGRFRVVSGGTTIARCHGSRLVIYEGYAWDGLTMWPDNPANLAGSLPHDFGYQLGGVEGNPFTRLECDQWLRDIIAPRSRWEAAVTYRGVRLCGRAFYGKKTNVKIIKY